MMDWSRATITSVKAAFEMHSVALSTKQSMEKAQRLRHGWALNASFTDHILRKRLEAEDSMGRIQEACDALSIVEVFSALQKGFVSWL